MGRAFPAGAAFLTALLLSAGTAFAAFPGKPGPIVYVKTSQEEVGDEGEVESTGGLYVDPPGRRRRPRQLTFNRTDSEPAVSPNGRQIAFFSVGEEGPGIYLIGIDGSGRQKLFEGRAPAFLRGGNAIVFSRVVDGKSHIWSRRLDGARVRQLTRGPFNDYEPAVSPNGRQIVFASDRDPDGRRDRSDIFSMRPNGSRLRVLIDGPRREEEPDFAPNGHRIAFVRGAVFGSKILTARANGRRIRLLTPCRNRTRIRCASYSEPAFSPNGRQIAVHTGGSRSSSILTIGSRRRGTGREVDSGGTEEEGFGSYVSEPSWGPRPRPR
jgi:Tol biopolymer transport system component